MYCCTCAGWCTHIGPHSYWAYEVSNIELLPKELSIRTTDGLVNGRPALTWHGKSYGWRACYRYQLKGRIHWTDGYYAATAEEAIDKLLAWANELLEQSK